MATPISELAPSDSSPIVSPLPAKDGAEQLRQWKSIGAILTFQRWVTIIGGLAIASLIVCVLSLQFGATKIDLRTVMTVLSRWWGSGVPDTAGIDTSAMIMFHIRLPRVLTGFLVGGGLAVVGVTLQALLRNPLADPYVLGVSSGAALGVSLAMLFSIGTTLAFLPGLPLFGFVGGLLSLVVMYRLARSQGRLPIQSVLLAGVILNAMLTALIMFITSIMDPNRSAGLMAWLMGSLTVSNYGMLSLFALYVLGGASLLLQKAQTMNILTFGEETARSLGIDTERVKKRLFFLAALLTGAVVSVSGMIGFVGMIVPHAVRMLVGSDHRVLLPASIFAGGMFLVAADTVARTVLAPTEIPVGIVTALTGGPMFLYLLLWRKEQLV
ncbi:MAG: iron ABC transporter permease [Nitrospira sp.]|nr:iron ABC transporter permease [Nitrospira sp.]